MARSGKVPYVEFSDENGVKAVVVGEIDRSEIPGLLGQDWGGGDDA